MKYCHQVLFKSIPATGDDDILGPVFLETLSLPLSKQLWFSLAFPDRRVKLNSLLLPWNSTWKAVGSRNGLRPSVKVELPCHRLCPMRVIKILSTHAQRLDREGEKIFAEVPPSAILTTPLLKKAAVIPPARALLALVIANPYRVHWGRRPRPLHA